MSAQLLGEVAHVVRQLRYFMVETVNLRRIADNRAERVQVIVELPLQVRRAFHFLLRPYMSRGLHQHDLLLILQFFLGLVSINQNHSRKGRIVLRLYLRDTGAQQQNPYRDYPLHRSSFLLSFFQRAVAAALRQRDMARRATSPLLRSIIPAVMLFHTSFRV